MLYREKVPDHRTVSLDGKAAAVVLVLAIIVAAVILVVMNGPY